MIPATEWMHGQLGYHTSLGVLLSVLHIHVCTANRTPCICTTCTATTTTVLQGHQPGRTDMTPTPAFDRSSPYHYLSK